MTSTARLRATVVAAVVLTAAMAGCSSGPEESSAASSTVPVTSSAPIAPSATGTGEPGGAQAPAPAASRPLTDFVEGSSEGPQYSFHSFATPSGRIQCRFVDGGLACQTGADPHTVAESALCDFYPGIEQGNAVRFGYFDGAPKQPCATIIQGDGFQSPHTLAYGQSVTAPLRSGTTVTCTSASDGLTCTQTGGTGPRGFFLSADTFTIL
ncbi:hypothetical protein ACFQWH_14305 [Mycolicibacterium sp. GCM10028919]|jgi:hypothetical protein|uniref:hypothetical protein n=1 Tax=Mycolicibacterium sp. GCM10028919 TaxID=3273401 RepID=UPI00360CEBDA